MAGGSALLKKRPLVLGAIAVVVALAIAVTLAVTKPWASTKDRNDVAPPAAGDRVLQSVDVALQPNGALTRVGDTVVIARAQGGRSDTYSTTYDPTKVVDQLPVRVLTAYQTDKGSGTDLGDLKGYTGRLTIDVTVQNLTVRPQQLTYDVAGRSRTTTALVGAPLTVVASAALPGVDPSTVVSAAADAGTTSSSDTGSTNGVVSRAQDGTAQVQWASILAPPQLDSTATFRVVVDAKDFTVPTVDLSVQPGLVTDPSVGALIDSAFNPKNSDELALETRTIKLVGNVNDVLGQASDTISGVRKTLDASSKTLGTKTVQSLTEDTKTISTSLKSSSDDVDALGDDLKKSLQTTQSATLQRMSETVSGLQDLIGDTSAPVPSVSVDGSGCAAKVKQSAGGGGGVYGDLLGVVAQLQTYASTTGECKAELQKAIATSIGTVDTHTGEPVCADAAPNSVVCSLEKVESQIHDLFAGVTTSIEDGQTAASGVYGAVDAARKDLGTQLAELATSADGLEEAAKRAKAADAAAARLEAALGRVRKSAALNAVKVESIGRQTDGLAKALCAVTGDGKQPGRLSRTQVEALRSWLVDRSCDGKDDLKPAGGWPVSISDRLHGQTKAWQQVDADLATTGDGSVAAELSNLRAQLKALIQALDGGSGDRAGITKGIGDAQQALAQLGDSIDGTQTRYGRAKLELKAALEQARQNSQNVGNVDLQPVIKEVAASAASSSDELGKAFDASAAGLGSAAEALRDGTAATLKKQQQDLADQEKSDEADLSSKTKAGLAQVSGSVTSATRDLDTTRTSLTKDLGNVLLDLGDPAQPDKGLIGTLGKSARAADSADFQLGLASDTVSAYSSVRSQEVSGILLRQAQAEAALQRQAELPAFETDLPANTQHRTIYELHLGADR